MTTATLEKRVRTLENEVKTLKTVFQRGAVILREKKTPMKKLSAGLRQALKEVREGKIAGPFNTVDELMADLES